MPELRTIPGTPGFTDSYLPNQRDSPGISPAESGPK
jgi:hypothetical protein